MDFRNVLANAKEQLGSYAEYSVKNITHICSEYGPRECGSESEKKAQEYMGEQLKNYADSVTRETFDAHPKAFMSFVPIAGGMLLASTAANLAGAFKKNKAAAASVPLLGAALASVVGEFGLYKQPLDPLFEKKQSGNVIAVRKASGETKRRIIISGHTDSAPEWTYTYKLGSKGVVTVAGYAVAGLLYDIAATAVSLRSKNSKLKKGLALGQLAFVPAFAGLFKFTDQNRHVDGASDDLSGCYIANSVLKFLADNDIRFENTEVIAMLAGGEECGLRGSKAFFAAHPELLNDGVETVFVGFDTIRDEEYMMIYTKDLNGLVKNDIDACNLVKNAAAKCGKDVPFGAIPLGSTDAAAASQAGCKAASFVAMDPAPARYYHTRLDTADNLVPSTIEKTVEIALQTVFDFDEKGLE
ncbi:MAG: M28 family peptidase [Oscillospiraceae bacterium]|nr:M28 family peptidase [Oscillospiraceae bacterium]